MSRLKARIVDLIAALGPISVADYMALCLSDPREGYYMTRDPFGRHGDFTTAPEISQMFGELIGAWIVATWQGIGNPNDVVIAEIGPGRGTMMKDVIRTIGKLQPDLLACASFRLVETSPTLQRTQAETLARSAGHSAWHQNIDELPQRPLILVGNELFDAIPVRQYVKTNGGWHERMVGIDSDQNLAFIAGAGSVDPSLLPAGAAAAPEGSIVELAPARTALMQQIAERIAQSGGAALFFDYGYLVPGIGDTLQAVRNHAPVGPLECPGEADLTTHVDFATLAHVARRAGLQTRIATQGKFLLALGLLERAGALGASGSAEMRARLAADVERLAGPDGMGELFKVLAIARHGMTLPGFAIN